MIKIGIVDEQSLYLNNVSKFLEMTYGDKLCIKTYNDPLKIYSDILEKKDFDILIIDNILHGIDGFELIKRIRSIYRPYIVLISVLLKFDIFDENIFINYKLKKPINYNKLKKIMDELIQKVEQEKRKTIKRDIEEIFNKEKGIKIIRQKNLLMKIITLLLNDEDMKNGETYKKLTEGIDRHETTIRKNVNEMINKMDKNTLDNLGFESKPKCLEFLNNFTYKIKKDINIEKMKKVKHK